MLYYIALGFLILHYFFDTHYFVRTIFHGVIARFFAKKLSFLEPSCFYGICMTTDVDFALNHMNNARYLREFDFGRLVHGLRTKFYDDFAKRQGAQFFAAGSTTRYRLPLKIFAPYKVVTVPVWWDGKFFFFDQRLITLADGIVRAVAYTKIASTVNIEDFMRETCPELEKPPMPEDVGKWLESQEISRTNMNNENNRKKNL